MQETGHDQLVAGFQRRVVALNALRHALVMGGLWAFAWGTGVLILRAVTDLPPRWLALGAAGFAVVLVAAVVRAQRARPSAAAIRALCDDYSKAGGLLMAEGEGAIGAWRDRLPTLALPDLRWRGERALGVFGVAAAFVLASFLVPTRFVRPAADGGLDVSADVARLDEQVQILEEEAVLEEQEAQAVRERLEQVREEAKGQDPAKTWEALDHLADRVEQDAQEAAQEAIRETESLTETQTLAEALQNDGDQLSPEQMAEAMAALSELAQAAAAENAALQSSLSPALQQALKNGGLSKEQLAQLNQALQGRKMGIENSLSRMVDVKLIEAKLLGQCKAAGQCNSEGLAEFLVFNLSQNQSVTNSLESWCRGGISRGRGDAEMVWKQNPSSEDGAKFQEQVLPPAALEAMKDSRMVGLSGGAPTRDAEAPAATGGALTSAAAGGGSAAKQVVLPRHRAAVQKYFERTGAGTAGEPH